MTYYYTGAEKGYEAAAEIAGRAWTGELTPEFLRSVPEGVLPENIAGLGKPES